MTTYQVSLEQMEFVGGEMDREHSFEASQPLVQHDVQHRVALGRTA